MRNSYWIGLLIIITASFMVWFYFIKPAGTSRKNIETAQVSKRDISSTVLATGIVKPQVGAEVKVGSRISGVVEKLKANIGDYVQAGQVIAELDNAELKAKLNQSFAALKKAQADYEYSKMNLAREESLLEQNYISQQQYDLALHSLKIAEAHLKQAQANVRIAEVQLSYTTIYALTSGVISSVSTQEGETVLAGLAAPTFVNIIDLNRLEVQVYVDETDIGKINVGQNVTFTVDTYSETVFNGKVTAIFPKAAIQDNVINYIVVVEIEDFQDKILRPEMTTTVTIHLATRKKVLTIPSRAVFREKGERFVTVKDGDAHTKKKIKTGWYDHNITEVVEGLADGEIILLPQ